MDNRPNPDKLLETIKQDKNPSRGTLKIFFGYAAGVGKTYAMLDAAHQAKLNNIDIVVGYIEPHTRPETMTLLEGLEQIPNLKIDYKGIILKEFDLDTALRRKPQIILVDELAHTNAEGMRHKKRYNDIEELLNNGINVYTTVNVQHIESLNDQIASLTGVFVKETIPDIIFDNSEHVELIDIEPEDLINRLKSGKIYKSVQAHKAMSNFFTVENLIALREIALRRTADRVNKDFETIKLGDYSQGSTTERILVCISGSPTSPKVIRTAARMSEAFKAPLLALYVERDNLNHNQNMNSNLEKNIKLAEQLGAKVISIYGGDIAKQIAEYSHINGITKIIIGRNQNKSRFIKKNIVDKLLELSPRIDIYVIPDTSKSIKYRVPKQIKNLPKFQFSIINVIIVIATMIISTLIGIAFDKFGYSESTIIVVYILGVLIISKYTIGYWYGIISSLIAVLAFNFFFTNPLYTFSAYGTQYPVTFMIMLASAIITSTLTTKLQHQVAISELKEKRMEILFETTQKLLQAKGEREIAQITCNMIFKLFDKNVAVYLSNGEKLTNKGNDFLDKDEKIIVDWVYKNNKEAGSQTDTLPSSNGYYIPVHGRKKIFAVIGIDENGESKLNIHQKSLLNSIIAQIILAFEKEELYQIQQTSKMEIEKERLRNNLLRAISHDLRTPLTTICGSTDTLLNNNSYLDNNMKRELLQNIYNDSQWLINLVENLLSVSRIDDGNIKLNKRTEVVEEIVAEALTHLDRRSKEHEIILNLPDELIEIKVDAKLIEQVLINIINNAIKYTQKDSKIALDVTKEVKKVNFIISDNGRGIDESDIPHIFDMFYTASKKSDSERGLGLGLSLCKSIINAHSGEIGAKNNKEGGATFYFYIPLN